MGHSEAAGEEFHVLAVDDSIVDRKIIERLLKISSFQVTTVNSVGKALEFLGLDDEDDQGLNDNDNDNKVNMIITDYCMPGMTGYDLLRKVKESSALKDIPVVIMSSENEESRITRCLSEGAEEFLLKPVQLSDVEKFRSYMHIRRAARDPQHQPQPPSSNKRKSISESLSPRPERRPRLSGLTVA